MSGGRWNSPGTRLVYTSATASLATLEIVANVGRTDLLLAYVLISCEFDESLITRLDRTRLPHNWRDFPAPPELAALGDEWVRSERSVVLEVPSALIEHESNFLINPSHSGIRAVRINAPQPYRFDLRLARP
jgi:RES domain-containing protein